MKFKIERKKRSWFSSWEVVKDDFPSRQDALNYAIIFREPKYQYRIRVT